MISLIWAMDKNNLIGKDNLLPWHYKEDLAYFKKTTTNKTVLMGLNTFNSIVSYLNKPLPNRKSIVASLEEFSYPGIEVTTDLISFLKEKRDEEIFIIGGKMIYELALPYADRLYITHINKEYQGNVYFPNIDYSKYKTVSKTDSNELCFAVYERIL